MKYLSLILFCTTLTLAQFNPGAKQISLANSDAALSNDVFSLFNNPAGLSQLNWTEVGIYYSPAPFGLTELANGYIAFNEPFSFGSVSLGGMTYGYEVYRESKVLLAYSYNYQNKFFVGAAVNYHTVSIQNYGSDNAFYFNLGGLAYLTNDFRIGFSFQNINRASFGNEDGQIPVVLNAGISYDVINTLTLNAAIEKDIKQKASFMFGVDYDLIEYLSLRTGFSNEPSRFSAGIGINYSLLSLDYAMFTHSDLGLTHQVGLIISFDKNGSRREMIRNFLGIK
ncbi:MAG: hypothetical protein ACK4R9_02040 [Ignavibacterium sp.]